MKTYYVYEIINILGSVEYVGQTSNLKARWYNHTKNIKGSGSGKFYNRSDVFINLVKKFDNKSDSLNYEEELQKEYGFTTDRSKRRKSAIIGGNAAKAKNIQNLDIHRKNGTIGGNKIALLRSVPIVAYTYPDLKMVGNFNSSMDASRNLNIGGGEISKILNKKRNSVKGYTFRYA
jgi:predicted GIY-YIG superfamily endonuclease